MNASYPVVSLVLTATLLFSDAARGLSLRDQLALAEKDEDTHAQIELIRRILDNEPGDDELHGQLADLWLSVDDYDMAEATLREWRNPPEAVRISVMAAVLFERDRKKDQAVALLDGYLAGHPENLEITRQLADYLSGLGGEAKVVALLGKAPGVENQADLLLARAVARRAVQDFSGALKDFAAADRLAPEAEAVTSSRASFDRLRAALAGINTASALLASKPDDPVARGWRAYWYLFTGFASDRALEDAEAARRAEPGSIVARMLLAQAAHQAGKLTDREALDKFAVDVTKPIPTLEVIDSLQRLDARLAKNPGDLSALIARSRELSEARQDTLALRDAQAALAIEPGSIRARAQEIAALVRLGRIDEAAAELRALEAAKPPRDVLAGALHELAEGNAAASQFDLALEYANRAIKAKPAARYYRQRAVILQRLERYADAQEDLSRAERIEKEGAQ